MQLRVERTVTACFVFLLSLRILAFLLIKVFFFQEITAHLKKKGSPQMPSKFNYQCLCPLPSFIIGLLNSLLSQQASLNCILIGFSVVTRRKNSCCECKNNDRYFPQCLLLHHCGCMLLAGFKLLISCDCSSEMNTSNFLVNIWPKPDSKKCQSDLFIRCTSGKRFL